MNITPSTKTITTYALEISEADAAEALIDPYSFGERLAEQLRAAGLVANGNSKARLKPKLESHIQVGRGRKATKAGLRMARAAKSPNRRAGSTGGLNRVRCPECQQEIAAKYLPLHRSKKHGIAPTTGNGAHPEAAPAAA